MGRGPSDEQARDAIRHRRLRRRRGRCAIARRGAPLMGNYISYDRKEAEGYARSLKKQQEREAAAREEKRIWDEFAAEQMRQEREKSASSGVSRTPRQPKPRAAKLTDRERGEDILRRALALLRSRTEKAVSICRAVPQNGKHAAVIRDLLDPDSVIRF